MLKRIPLALIDPNPDQPRKTFDPHALEELAASIRENGLMQPITVTPKGDRYMIVAGERRWRAHCLLSDRDALPEGSILAHVRRMTAEEIAVSAIIENLVRADISPLEEARAFQRMLDHGLSFEDLARRLGISQPFRIRERVHLLRLEPAIQKMLSSGQLSAAAAYEVARLEKKDQSRLVRMINKGQLPTIGAIRAAVQTAMDREAQTSLLSAPEPTRSEMRAMKSMERKIDAIVDMVSSGFKDGECVIAARVSRDRARLAADRLDQSVKAIGMMSRSLREALAQSDIAEQMAS